MAKLKVLTVTFQAGKSVKLPQGAIIEEAYANVADNTFTITYRVPKGKIIKSYVAPPDIKTVLEDVINRGDWEIDDEISF